MTRGSTGGLVVAMGLAGACVLVPPDPREPLRELRALQRGQVDRLAATFCGRYFECRCDDPIAAYPSEAECVDRISSGLLQRLEPGIDEELDYDPDCLDANVELIEALGCAPVDVAAADDALARQLDAARRCRTYSGTKERGDTCTPLVGTRGDECAPGLRCHEQFQGCLEPTSPMEGSPCPDPGQTCDDPACDEGSCDPRRALVCGLEADLP